MNGAGDLAFGGLIDLALRGEGPARQALQETAKYLGIGIANLIRGLAPEAVIVGGPIVRSWPVIAEEIRTAIEATTCRGLPSTRIIASTLGPEPTLMGALSLVLASKFASVSFT
jgi:predicted NBD/HSP70 family sugar kinase